MLNRRLMAPVALIVLTTVAGAPAETTEKHSGTVVAIDARAGVLRLAEVGPSPVVAGKTEVTEQTFALTRITVYAAFRRVPGPGQFAGDFIEVAAEATDVAIGHHATVECVRQGGRLVARKVTLADPKSDPRATATQQAPTGQPLPPAAAAMPRLPVTERMEISEPTNESRPPTEVVRPASPAGGTEPDPRAVIDWLLNPATR